MKKFVCIVGISVAAFATHSVTVNADSHVPGAVKARQAVMQLNQFYLGQLGAMATGKAEYNAEKALAAARSLKLIEADGIDQSAMWIPGTSTAELGEATRAKPEIWTTWPAITKEIGAAKKAIDAMAEQAGTLEGLQATIGAVGKSCSACHQYRASRN